MTTNDNEIKPKLSFRFYCEKCDYGTCKKSNMDNHNMSAKHNKTTNDNEIKPKLSQHHICENCNKEYNDRAGLWRHKKKCIISDKDNNININMNLVMEILKDNNDFKQLLIEQSKTIQQLSMNTNTVNHSHNTTTNSHNKAFNLNFFLNETCKNAMNITDFVDSIQLKLSDLERVGDLGFVKGISDIIVDKLNALDVTVRPIHCTDQKREVLYVKDEDKWNKEDQENNKVRKVVKKVANKNTKLLKDFKDKHPDCVKSISSFSDRYNKLTIEAYGGIGNDFRDNENKIIKNISKVITIEKE